jgi:hypothetical protein
MSDPPSRVYIFSREDSSLAPHQQRPCKNGHHLLYLCGVSYDPPTHDTHAPLSEPLHGGMLCDIETLSF